MALVNSFTPPPGQGQIWRGPLAVKFYYQSYFQSGEMVGPPGVEQSCFQELRMRLLPEIHRAEHTVTYTWSHHWSTLGAYHTQENTHGQSAGENISIPVMTESKPNHHHADSKCKSPRRSKTKQRLNMELESEPLKLPVRVCPAQTQSILTPGTYAMVAIIVPNRKENGTAGFFLCSQNILFPCNRHHQWFNKKSNYETWLIVIIDY